MIRIRSINTLRSSYYNWILFVVAAVVVSFHPGCSVLTEFDRNMIINEEIREGGSEQPIPMFDGGQSDVSTPGDSGRRETSVPLGDASIRCSEPSDCPTFANACFETSCVDGICIAINNAATTECDAECGTIVDECGNNVECGRCDAGSICVNNSCLSECGGCEIDGICYETGAVNPTNQCEICSPAISSTSWSPNSGALCDDGKFCTVSDFCDGTVCSGKSRNCDDGIGCNGQETCSETDGACLIGIPTCSNAQYCDAASNACVSMCGTTQCIINRTCYEVGAFNAANKCLVCNSAVNRDNWSIAVGETCGDAATECSGIDTCDGSGNCLPNNAPRGTRCGSAEAECSGQDTCDGKGNCLPNHYSPHNKCGTPAECENQDYCDGNGSCIDWGFKLVFSPCGEGPTDCSNQDWCDLLGRCQPNHKADGIFCGEGNSRCSWHVCKQGRCDNQLVSGDACDDGNPCTTDGCLNYNDNCLPGEPVADGTRCGKNESECSWRECNAGVCGTESLSESCDDDIDCTDDSCDPINGCQNIPNNYRCNDNIDCTDDACNPACTPDSQYCDPEIVGCEHKPNHDVCNTNLACVTGSSCDPAKCDSCKTNPNCSCNENKGCVDNLNHAYCRTGMGSDGIDCTDDSCNPNNPDTSNTGGCQHVPNDNACPGDDDLCTFDICDPNTGCYPDNGKCGDAGIGPPSG